MPGNLVVGVNLVRIVGNKHTAITVINAVDFVGSCVMVVIHSLGFTKRAVRFERFFGMLLTSWSHSVQAIDSELR